MTREVPFAQVDVFSREAFRGNPVAVIFDGSLTDAEMQRIARWTNLSETTFVLPPTPEAAARGADYRLRIFTPGGELPFAGHPTLGSARAWLELGGVPRVDGVIVQECAAGLIELRHDGELLSFAAPPTVRTGPLDEGYVARLVGALGIAPEQVLDHQWVDNGPGWAVLQVATADEVLAIEPDLSMIPDAKIGVIGAYPEGSTHAFEIRAFVPALGVGEDPVTGSLNASVAQWLTGSGRAPDRYSVSQGLRLGRAGEVEITVERGAGRADPDSTGATRVWVGGATTVRFVGTARV